MEGNNYAFIDSQNLNLAIREQNWILDFGRFRKYLKDKYSVNKAFIFVGYVKGNENMYANLQSQGYMVIFKPTLELPNGGVKGNVDAELVLHTMIEYDNFNKAIIVSNDGDFYCLVDYLIKNKKLERLLISNRNSFSSLLKKFRPFMHFMNGLKNKLEYKNPNKNSS